MRLRRQLSCTLCLLLWTGLVGAKPRSFDLGEGGRLEIDVPDGWTIEKPGKNPDDVPWLDITPPSGKPLVLILTATPLRKEDSDPLRTSRRVAEQMAADMKKISVEKELPVKEIKGAESRGFYVSATDRTVEKPTATDFKYEEQGGVVFGRFFLQFRLLTNLPDAPEHAQALDVVRSARYVRPDAPAKPGS